MNKSILSLLIVASIFQLASQVNVLKTIKLSNNATLPDANPKDEADHKKMMVYYDQQMKKPLEENLGDLGDLGDKQDIDEENAKKALKNHDHAQYEKLTKEADIDFQKILTKFRAITDRVEDWKTMKKQRACDLKNSTEKAIKLLNEVLPDLEKDVKGARGDKKKDEGVDLTHAINEAEKKLVADHIKLITLCPTNVLKKLKLSFKANQPDSNPKDEAEHKMIMAYYDQQMKKPFEENVLDIGELASKQDMNEENAKKALKNHDDAQYKKLTKEADIEFQKILANFRAVADRHEDWKNMKKQRACDLQNATEGALKSLEEVKGDIENDIKGESGDRKKHQSTEMKPAMNEAIKVLVANDKKASALCKA